MKPHRPYTLEEYNPQWKETFKEVSGKVKKALGDIAIEVEHIGSTSVEGMVAKPQIDILVIVKDLDVVATKYQEMITEGFAHHGIGYVNEDDDYFSLNTQEGKRVASIHILEEGNAKINYYLIFRDYLRTHPSERDLYIGVKKDLYSKYSENYADYDGGKSDVILEIRGRAVDWFDRLKANNN
jgi:GrpB-like predicted nucleotidyltransferase (UPF0157 family)